MRTWVVPCRYDPIVFRCVESIRTHHPDDRIVVVDSCSEVATYLLDLDAYRVDIIPGNTDYMTGAYGAAMNRYRSDQWAFIHDSLIVNRPIPEQACTRVRWFTQDRCADQAQFIDEALHRMGLEEPPHWHGVFGSMLFCDDDTAQEVRSSGLFDLEVPDKVCASATERLMGMVLAHRPLVSFQGQHGSPWDPQDEVFVTKVFKDRP
jgi:hypothetical protein